VFEYDVTISLPGEQRTEAEAIANRLTSRNVKVFYDRYEQANLWGKDLYEHLFDVYQKKARCTFEFLLPGKKERRRQPRLTPSLHGDTFVR
jgi:hypothetical protein